LPDALGVQFLGSGIISVYNEEYNNYYKKLSEAIGHKVLLVKFEMGECRHIDNIMLITDL